MVEILCVVFPASCLMHTVVLVGVGDPQIVSLNGCKLWSLAGLFTVPFLLVFNC